MYTKNWRSCCLIVIVSAGSVFWHDSNALPIEEVDTAQLETGQLIFTNVLYRHGDRVPIPLCPNDPLNNENLWPKEWSQLTNLGSQEQYMLGQWLRQRYGSLLSRTYKPSQIYVRSTDVDRTIASALSNLAGLYPPLLTEMWHPDIRWQPIPVHTVAASEDYLMGTANCPEHTKLVSKILNNITESLAPMFDDLTELCGRPISKFSEFVGMYDGFKVEELFGRSVPHWARPYYGNDFFERLYYSIFVVGTSTPEMARFQSGPLIKEMLTNMRKKVDGVLSPDRSMFMYSGHDITVSSLLNSLNMYNFTDPPYPHPGYASVVLMELRLDEAENPFVSIVYRNDTYAKPELLTIPNCGTKCPLDTMFTLYEHILPDDIVAECQGTN